ncbi:DUF4405 domain-containing protein [Dongia sp.]|uniref:DUF4405 domain-containing protein n=1 Tax=Dongia sp. TaxID=1977262 RepID=UPI0035AFC981
MKRSAGFAADFEDAIMTMRDFIFKYATGAATGLFLVSGISGLALFFHFQPALFKDLHEWLGLGLLLVVGLHLYRNWPAFLGYIRRRTLFAPLAISLALGALFVVPTLSSGAASGGGGMARIMAGLEHASVDDMSALLETSPEALAKHLVGMGYVVTGPSDTVAAIAEKAGQPAREIIMAATGVPAAGAPLAPAN